MVPATSLESNTVDYPVLLSPTPEILTDPEGRSHPMLVEGHLPLSTWPVSGVPGSLKDFQMQLLPSLGNPGDFLQNQPNQVPGDCGIVGVLNRISIPFQPLSEKF